MAGVALSIPLGGTSQTTAEGARIALGLEIGVMVQAWDADLDAVAALAGTGIAVRTAANTWALRTITGTANEITVTNGSGVSGNPTLSLPTALTFTGKTITGGNYTSPTVNGTLTASGTVTMSGTFSGGTYISAAFNGTLGATTPSSIVATTGSFSSLLTVNANIQFPATQVADAGANVLDDYEEGTWTPAFGTTGVAFTTVTYSAQTGHYEKIGRMVRVFGHITVSALTVGAASGNLFMNGFPFTSAVFGPPMTIGYIDAFTTNTPIHTAMSASTTCNLYHRTAVTTGAVPSTFAVLSSTSDIYFGGTYHV